MDIFGSGFFRSGWGVSFLIVLAHEFAQLAAGGQRAQLGFAVRRVRYPPHRVPEQRGQNHLWHDAEVRVPLQMT
jgi:hypothetical protein